MIERCQKAVDSVNKDIECGTIYYSCMTELAKYKLDFIALCETMESQVDKMEGICLVIGEYCKLKNDVALLWKATKNVLEGKVLV